MHKHLLLLLVPATMYSCRKTPANLNLPVQQISKQAESAYDYFPMKPGNYWVYGSYQGDTNGISNLQTYEFDSVYVRKDTIVNGHTYYILDEAPYPQGLGGIFRDSSGYMVNINGSISFATQNFTFTHIDSLSFGLFLDVYRWQMVNNITAKTPAGSFSSLEYRGSLIYCSSYPANPKFYKAYDYSKQLGLTIMRSYYQNNANAILEWELVRYHVQ